MDWQTIFNEYRPRIFRYLTRLVGPLDAEDLTQEVFLKVNQGLDCFRAEAKISTWLYRIATNAAVDLQRRNKSRPSLVMAIQEERDDCVRGEYPFDADMDGCPQHKIELQEMNACIRGLLDRLPEHYRTVLLLSEAEGFTGKEVGEILGLSLATVKIRLYRGKERLRASINRNCVISLDGRNEFLCVPKT